MTNKVSCLADLDFSDNNELSRNHTFQSLKCNYN